jgi:endonuclease/exonuclease/phosphatase family metal-dependent hydrolase
MKIVQLNIWMGKIEGKLERFLQETDADVICMQEVINSDDTTLHVSRLWFDTSRILRANPEFKYYKYFPNWSADIADGTMQMGNFVISKIPIVSTDMKFVHGQYTEHTILVQQPSNNTAVDIVKLENGITVVNHHGFWRKDPMGDEDSLKTFEKVGEVVKPLAEEGPLVMCGDLNVIHASPCFKYLDFLRDLTDENKVETTLSGARVPFKVPCDHILVNDEIEVKDFKVLPDIVSDHLALEAEVEIK